VHSQQQAIVTEEEHRLELIKCREVWDREEETRTSELYTYFEQRVIDRREEGLVVKDLTTPYTVGDNSEC
jgi:hypothetical protein